MTDHITVELLEALEACEYQVAAFSKAFPDGLTKEYASANTTEVVAIATQHGLGISWAAGWAAEFLLSAPASAAYNKANTSADAAYQKATAPARVAYSEATAAAQGTRAYKQAVASATASYRQAVAPAFAAHREALAIAFIRIWTGETT